MANPGGARAPPSAAPVHEHGSQTRLKSMEVTLVGKRGERPNANVSGTFLKD